MSTKQGRAGKVINIDINQLTTRTGNINNGILAEVGNFERFIVTDIDIDDLIPSEDNFYSLSDIDSLKENIKEFGLQQNLAVMRRPDKKYEIIAGHRRREACRLLVQEGNKKFKWLPCRIMPAMSETVKNILLITMNSETRKKTPAEITEEIERLKILYTDYKKENPNFKGRIRENIAKDMGMSVANVGRHEEISKNLIPEIKDAYKKNEVNFTAAVGLSKLSAADQKAVYEKTDGKVTVKDIKKQQPEPKPESENMNLDGFDPIVRPVVDDKKEQQSVPEEKEKTNPTFKGIMLLKQMFENKIEKAKKARDKEIEQNEGLIEVTTLSEYLRLLERQSQKFNFEMKGNDLFASGQE